MRMMQAIAQTLLLGSFAKELRLKNVKKSTMLIVQPAILLNAQVAIFIISFQEAHVNLARAPASIVAMKIIATHAFRQWFWTLTTNARKLVMNICLIVSFVLMHLPVQSVTVDIISII